MLKDSRDVIAATMPKIISICIKALTSGHKLMFFGNGGSAADAQHIATELTVRYTKNRVALAALSLCTDTSALTAIANDLSYDEIFSRQIEALGKPGDIAFGHLHLRSIRQCQYRFKEGPREGVDLHRLGRKRRRGDGRSL